MTSTTGRPAHLLKRAQATLHNALAQALRKPVAQYAVLTALEEEPGLSNADLARRAFVTPQTMNQVMRQLEERHWVTRHPHPGHGRILQAALTDSGRQTLQACQHARDRSRRAHADRAQQRPPRAVGHSTACLH